jgi:glucokinase
MMRRVGLIESTQQPAKDWIITLFDQADCGDRRSMALVQGAGVALGEAIANLVTVLPLSVVIISGGIAARLDALRPALTATLQRRLGSAHGAALEVREGMLGNDAGCLGAAALFEQS